MHFILFFLDINVISLIIKRQIPSLSRRQLFRCDEAFCNEIYAYTNVIPLLEQYINGPLFPKCFFAGKDELGEIIMLEDLKNLGYHMQNRLTGLDVNYCELVMKVRNYFNIGQKQVYITDIDYSSFRLIKMKKSHIKYVKIIILMTFHFRTHKGLSNRHKI